MDRNIEVVSAVLSVECYEQSSEALQDVLGRCLNFIKCRGNLSDRISAKDELFACQDEYGLQKDSLKEVFRFTTRIIEDENKEVMFGRSELKCIRHGVWHLLKGETRLLS